MIISSRSVVKKATGIFPITGWAKDYGAGVAVADLVAGITVALTLIPQSLAYASLAGLEPQYGLYSSFAGSLVYIFLGTTPEINIGPTALLSLLTFTYTNGTNADFPVLLCFLGGLVQLLVGFSRLGFLVDFVSIPVVSGFTSAASLIIACSQLKGLLGLSFKAETFIDIWKELADHIYDVRIGDAVLSIACCIVLLAMRQLKEIKIKPKKGEDLSKKQKVIQNALWFTSVGRNAAVVIGCAVVAYVLEIYDSTFFRLTGNIVSGLPRFGAPNFNTTVGNDTYTFSEMAGHLGSGIIVVPLIGIIANVAIAKAFSKGKMLDASQEIVALSICNIVSSFVQSFPVNGSFSRSAVSNASGVRTPGAGLYTGIIVLMTLGFLTPYFYFIPKATLSSVIICAVLFMIDIDIVKDLWINSRLDLIPLFGTFVACLFVGVEYGILVGIAIDIILLLYFNARPRLKMDVVVLNPDTMYTVVIPSGGLFFPSANYVRETIGKAGSIKKSLDPLESKDKHIFVIDCMYLQRADWTSLQGIKSLLLDFRKINKTVIFLHCRPKIKEKLQIEIKEHFIYCSTQDELNHLLNNNFANGFISEIKLEVPDDERQNTRESTTSF